MISQVLYSIKDYFKTHEYVSVSKLVQKSESGDFFITVFNKNGESSKINFEKGISHVRPNMEISRGFFSNLAVLCLDEFGDKIIDYRSFKKQPISLKSEIKALDSDIKLFILSKNHYPFISLPEKVRNIEIGLNDELKNLKPPSPELYLKKINYLDYLFCSILLIVLTFAYFINWLSFIYLSIGSIVICFLVKGSIDVTKIRTKQNRTTKQKYREQLEKTNVENKERIILVSKLKANNKMKSYSCNQILNILSKYDFSDEINKYYEKANKGRYELKFKKDLENIFGDKIYDDLIFNFRRDSDEYLNDSMELYYSNSINNDYIIDRMDKKYKNSYYTPDLIYKDDKICINIEIDQPYTTNLKPIHIKDNLIEHSRNNFFNSKNWIVLRFSENQVANNSLACCTFLAYMIVRYTDNYNYLEFIKRTSGTLPFLQSENRWSMLDVEDMINQNYRVLD
jgi:hypothetical protein